MFQLIVSFAPRCLYGWSTEVADAAVAVKILFSPIFHLFLLVPECDVLMFTWKYIFFTSYCCAAVCNYVSCTLLSSFFLTLSAEQNGAGGFLHGCKNDTWWGVWYWLFAVLCVWNDLIGFALSWRKEIIIFSFFLIFVCCELCCEFVSFLAVCFFFFLLVFICSYTEYVFREFFAVLRLLVGYFLI